MIGVYYLYKQDVLIYIGSSICVERRIKQHERNGSDFDRYKADRHDKNRIREIEAKEIRDKKPTQNIIIPPLSIDSKPSEYKMIQVPEDAHLQAKRQAKEQGIPMRDYIQLLLDKDKK